MKRDNAEKDYTAQQFHDAEKYFKNLIDTEKKKLHDTILLGLPGSLERYTLDEFKKALKEYENIDHDKLQNNLLLFLKEIIPVAEQAGVYMVIHADDPPWSLLGLPRVVSNNEDVKQILNAVDSPHNGLTLCTGSFGASVKNNLVAMAEGFAHRINFLHLRNVARNDEGDFLEENHLDGDINLYGVIKALVVEQNKRIEEGRKDCRIPVRPDHGHLMIPDQNKQGIYPGYSLFGRMRGLAEVRGLEFGIRHALNIK